MLFQQYFCLWIIYFSFFQRVKSSGFDNEEDTIKCIELSKLGKCHDGSMDDYTRNSCKDICEELNRDRLNFIRYEMKDNTFHDATITLSTGESISFGRFEGYFTLIIPIAKICEGKVKFSDMVKQINSLKQLSKLMYSVEIIVFPYEFQGTDYRHPDENPTMTYDGKDCSDFDTEYYKERKDKHPIHMLQLDHYIGEDIPSFWQIIQKEVGIETLKLDTTAYFLVYPDLNKFEYHYGKSLLDMKDILLETTKLMEGNEF